MQLLAFRVFVNWLCFYLVIESFGLTINLVISRELLIGGKVVIGFQMLFIKGNNKLLKVLDD